MISRLLFWAALLLQQLYFSKADPIQFCRYGHRDGAIDFCMGAIMHHNYTTDDHDLYLTFTVTRSSALGWTAIGTGPVMAGSLMFIIYGDPYSGSDPIISVRTVNGHHQPRLVSPEDFLSGSLRVLSSNWFAEEQDYTTSAVYTAKVSLVCYSCTRWRGTPISAESSSQPWIWAWNAQQNFAVYSYNADLDMHAHHAGSGGWGNFYVDMARSVSDMDGLPSVPQIRAEINEVGASDSPIGVIGLITWLESNPLVHSHGALMLIAFLVLFPLGVWAIRAKTASSFRYHWVIQILASVFVGAGATTGLIMSGRSLFNTSHQIIGIILFPSVFAQMFLGYRHHITFVTMRKRTWMSSSHVWLGRMVLIGGFANVLLGLLLANTRSLVLILVSILITLELLFLTFWAIRWKKVTKLGNTKQSEPSWEQRTGTYFALDDADDEGSETDGTEVPALKDPKPFP